MWYVKTASVLLTLNRMNNLTMRKSQTFIKMETSLEDQSDHETNFEIIESVHFCLSSKDNFSFFQNVLTGNEISLTSVFVRLLSTFIPLYVCTYSPVSTLSSYTRP